MFERIQHEGISPKTTTASVTTRADLVVAPAPASSELREKAVEPTSNATKSGTDNGALDQTVHLLGQMRNEMDSIATTDQDRKKLDEIYAKLFKSYEAAKKGPVSSEMKSEIDRTLDELDKSFKPDLLGQSDAPVDVADETTAEMAIRQQRERTLDKITVALRKVGVLRNKMADANQASHERLLNINSSLTGLNMARAQVDENVFSIESASSTVDSVMLNLRSIVLAHGKISSDVVRLVMS